MSLQGVMLHSSRLCLTQVRRLKALRWYQPTIDTRHILPLPKGLPASDYGLCAGLYQVEPLHCQTE